MSWAEVNKIDESARLRAYNGLFIIESSLTWTVPQSGYYKVIAVGGGGDWGSYGGGAGGVAIKTEFMQEGAEYIITISRDVFFDLEMTANGGSNGTSSGGTGGTATGGDFNYTGGNGSSSSGGSVGCYISGLMDKTEYYTQESNTSSATDISNGYGILGHGAGGLTSGNIKIPPQKGCVIIIPYIGI